MVARKAKGKMSWRVGTRSGLLRVNARVTPEHFRALEVEARRRASERGSIQPDMSEVLREALDAWMKRKK